MKTCAKAFYLIAAMSLWLSGSASGQSTVVSPATGLPVGNGALSPIDPATGLQKSYGPDTWSNIVEQDRKGAEAILAWDKAQSVLITNSVPPSPSDSEVRHALLIIQARDTQKFSQGQGDYKLFGDLYDVNGALGDDEATYALFQRIARDNPQLAGECGFTIEPLLVRRGEYQLCLDYIGNPEARFQFYCSLLGSLKGFGEGLNRMDELPRQSGLPPIQRTSHVHPGQYEIERAKTNFVVQVCCLVEVLVGTGHETEAEYIREKAMTILADARIQSAFVDAEKHIKNPKTTPSAGEMELKISPAYLSGLEPMVALPATPLPPIPPPARIDPGGGLPVVLRP